ncbi:RES domain-containing protein [Tangfeifania diversioriginum]|uniref:RES domain-containing protein n=1 Tax=Tangfeifania diversioriginum TaxID=1168035 RepID=A0A1M6JX48_9BACT|nr:RES family NAD+ phosphorylase [Tangfeifania diversioriginum]SHJ51295.1 RES domain-containing protein [Tangfeifania diversioriginum]
MIIYRIARTEFCDLSGEGAKLYGGRWNFAGHPVLYASSTIASALLERLTVDPELFASERYILYSIMEFDCPARLIKKISENELPANWDAIPFTKSSQQFGTELIQSDIVCFEVPSVVDKSSFNYIINPLAKNISKITWEIYPLELDKRIIK